MPSYFKFLAKRTSTWQVEKINSAELIKHNRTEVGRMDLKQKVRPEGWTVQTLYMITYFSGRKLKVQRVVTLPL